MYPSLPIQTRRFSPCWTRGKRNWRRSAPTPSSISRWPHCTRTRTPKPWIVSTPLLPMRDLREALDCDSVSAAAIGAQPPWWLGLVVCWNRRQARWNNHTLPCKLLILQLVDGFVEQRLRETYAINRSGQVEFRSLRLHISAKAKANRH